MYSKNKVLSKKANISLNKFKSDTKHVQRFIKDKYENSSYLQ